MSARDALLRVSRASSSISQGLARLTGLLIILLMIGVVADSLLRGVFGIAVWGILEFSTLMLLALIYLGLPSTQAERVNFRVSVFTDMLPSRWNFLLAGVLLLLQLGVLGVLCWFTWRSAIFSYSREEVSMGMVEIPLWPHRGLVSLGLSALWLQSLMSGIDLIIQKQHPYATDVIAEVEGAIQRQTL